YIKTQNIYFERHTIQYNAVKKSIKVASKNYKSFL
uniref:Uncharacterized protein n=1 Tax=Amphimedon queenslandica TaxID=400682 RepID=A0A1X7VFY2_AMPQE